MDERLPSVIQQLEENNNPTTDAADIISMLLECFGTPLGMSIPEFCKSVGISVRTYYALPPDERPPETRIGRRVIIRTETASEWLRQREQRSAM